MLSKKSTVTPQPGELTAAGFALRLMKNSAERRVKFYQLGGNE